MGDGGRRGQVDFRVRFAETDAAGVAYFGTFFTWFDVGTQALVRRDDGAPNVDFDGKPRSPLPIIECGATFASPVRFDQELTVFSQVTKLGTTSIRFEHEIRTRAGTLVARGFEQRVYVRFTDDGFVKQTIPVDLREHLSA